MASRRLTPADDLLAPAIDETIAKLEPDDVDAGVVQLARRYAALVDDAREAAALADDLADRIDPEDFTTGQMVARLGAKVQAQTVLAELGPKLLAALEQLGATPAARAKLRGGGAPVAGPNRLAALRQARQA
ncbi:terminase small subunit [Jiangella alkaliphila]|uniref:Terminase small subunit actinomycetes phage-type domain-containing protein n=1 Tax=Jiangella alkaliphila TaxID=419479 RepID=A0A1H2IEG7_9ACTN|nr:hypothetical protein [Jiangella alkaliphila]SDU42483.1 hypothetical protein SAMN04488563_1651 [Jiangella alkaliphila]